ncbi:hypothetical protein [Actomonas aquatica]|uniref:Uncharacterized protein n=1 Tax=Actomonas aquatica TaxID=2866162 RepID=A0ABZ1C964_9BACT|nr:hypothetical protein [Opitutus sp. WL0086]WRQ88242.1 hypothetical protein K1X11_002410 [Opitutus sp. WL0086]
MDPAEFAARLRAAGFDEATVKAIVWECIRAPSLFESEEVRQAPYWRRMAMITDLGQRQSLARRRGEVTADVATYRELFGEDPQTLQFEPNALSVRRAMRRTPEHVAAVVRELRDTLRKETPRDQSTRIINGQPDAATVANRAQREQAESNFEAGLRERFTETEYAAYLLYESRAAFFLRNNLDGLLLTQQEFDTIVTIMADSRSFSRDLANYTEPLTAALGEQRYAELAQATFGNDRANLIVSRLDLPFTTAITLQSIQDDISARERTLTRDRSLSSDAKTAQQAALAVEARTRLAAALSTEGYELYLAYAASWMNSLLQAEAGLQPGG